MSLQYTNDTLALLLGALANHRLHHEPMTLSVLLAHLEKAGFTLPRAEVLAVLRELSQLGVILVTGNLEVAEAARFVLIRRVLVAVPFDRVAGRFILGVLACNPERPMQVSEIRQIAGRLWPKDEVFNSVYLAVGALVESGELVSHSSGCDRDQLFVAIARVASLLV